jgi:hypothetical protein
MRSDDLDTLPDNLPVPRDDGACASARLRRMTSIRLIAIAGEARDPEVGMVWRWACPAGEKPR